MIATGFAQLYQAQPATDDELRNSAIYAAVRDYYTSTEAFDRALPHGVSKHDRLCAIPLEGWPRYQSTRFASDLRRRLMDAGGWTLTEWQEAKSAYMSSGDMDRDAAALPWPEASSVQHEVAAARS